jgi:hypothetical protein
VIESVARFRLTLTGVKPLLMHNARLADPLDPLTRAIKKITGKRKLTDDDHEEKARLEHAASLYMDDDLGPYIPGENISRCLVDAARFTKRGKDVERTLFISTDVCPLAYKGPRDAEGLYADANFRFRRVVNVGTSGTPRRVVRVRPRFGTWAVDCEGMINLDIIDFRTLEEIVQTAEVLVGMGDWRPRYGRFNAELERI